jgi:curved DNA-binding protein CbpA
MHPLRARWPLALIFILLAELLHDSSSFFVPAYSTRRMFAERPFFRPPPRLPLAVYSAGGSGDLRLAKLDFSECYYEVLECDRDCDAKELKKAYYRMVSKFHPDSRPESEKELANRQMMVVNGAYSVLRGERRGEYDKQRRKGLKGAAAGVKVSGRNTEGEDTESSDTESSSDRSRESTGTKSSANDAYSAYSYGADARARGTSWRSRPTGSHFDSNGGFSSTPYEFSRQRDRARSESTRPRGRGDGSLSSLKAQLASLQLHRRRKQQLLAGDKRDWGDVVDPDLIRKRLGDLQELRDLETQISEVGVRAVQRVCPCQCLLPLLNHSCISSLHS